MEKETSTMNVIVHKASLALMAGESLDQYTGELSKGCGGYMNKCLGIQKGSGSSWLVEAYANKCVVAAYKSDGPTEYYAMSYKRDAKTGAFEFGEYVPVVRRTVYQPVNTSVTISKEIGALEGWEKTEKSMWGNIL